MLYYDFKAGNREYKLRLNTRNIIELEKKLGCNPLMIFGKDGDSVPTVSAWLQFYMLHFNLVNMESNSMMLVIFLMIT